MRFPSGIRFWVLVIGLVLLAGGMIRGLLVASGRVQRLEAQLTASQIERFQLASEARREIQNLYDSMLRYALVRDPQEWAQFDLASSNLNNWIDHFDPTTNPQSPVTTDAERDVFKQLNIAYDDFLAAANAVHTNGQPALMNKGSLTELDAFNVQSARMRDLVHQLTEAHRTAEAAFLGNAVDSLVVLRDILIASLVSLLVLVMVLFWVIYRDMIAPLRVKLVHSQTLLEKQEKLVTLGTLAAGIAHEIRNPLTSLKARLYTLEKHLQTVPAARKDTDIIGAEISRLERIVQDVLNFARPSDPRLETISAETLLRDVQGLMAPNFEARKVQITVDSKPDLFIKVDSGHLKQVLINLVRNGAEAIDGTGSVKLSARASRARLGKMESDVVVLEVTDTGKGISPEAEKRLFDPFYSTKETGTGLGLPIAARIVEKHGGMLQYQTRPGAGTTFGVVLPREINDSTGNGKPVATTQSTDGQIRR